MPKICKKTAKKILRGAYIGSVLNAPHTLPHPTPTRPSPAPATRVAYM